MHESKESRMELSGMVHESCQHKTISFQITYELDIVWIIGTEACGGADFENTLAHKEANNELDLIVDGWNKGKFCKPIVQESWENWADTPIWWIYTYIEAIVVVKYTKGSIVDYRYERRSRRWKIDVDRVETVHTQWGKGYQLKTRVTVP